MEKILHFRVESAKFSVMKKVERKTADAVAKATIELLHPYKDQVMTITAASDDNHSSK